MKLKGQGNMTEGFCLTVETSEIMEKQQSPKPTRWLSCKGLVTGMGKEFVSSQGCAALPKACGTQDDTAQNLP